MSMLMPRPRPNVRASDADRERTADILRRQAGDGRLTPEELSARLDTAFTARTLGELQAVIADLPEGNVDPMSDLVSGVVNTGMRAARIGVAFAVGATVLGFAVPLVVGLGVAFGWVGGLIGLGTIVVALLVAARSFRRRRA
jgi:Domain of unknown function (DUF1707)